MAGGVARRAARRDEQRGGAHLDRLARPARRPGRGRRAARSSVGSRRGSTEQNSTMPRLWARAAPMASSRSPPCSQSCRRRLWNVLNTSWLAKPSRSRARGRSSATNEPVAAKFLRAMISAASAPRYSSLRVAGRRAVERRVEVAQLLVRVAGLAQLVAARVAQRLDAVADRRVGVVAQPGRRLHDVGVGVVHDEPRRVVPHGASVPPPHRATVDPARPTSVTVEGDGCRYRAGPVTAPAVAGRRGRVVQARACKALYPGSIPGVASSVQRQPRLTVRWVGGWG